MPVFYMLFGSAGHGTIKRSLTLLGPGMGNTSAAGDLRGSFVKDFPEHQPVCGGAHS
jgi:hypothetical protein